ncbi:MAG: NCS2 family nucleobase:cation symporter [Chloroflexota bacterium]|nr:NCS2 family nucleobase:cation symporter [Chloroflexota bacterium]
MATRTDVNAPMIVAYPETRLPILKTAALGIQHVLAMFGATVLAPLIMGFDPSLAILFSGVGTLLFIAITRGRVPSYLGSSFAFIAPVIAAQSEGGIPAALGGIIAAGVVYGIVGLIVMRTGVGWVEYLMPPVVTAAVVAVIGLALAHVAVDLAARNVWLALVSFSVAALVAVGTRGFPRLIPILIGAIVGYAVALLTGSVDLTAVRKAAWVGAPDFVTPTLNWRAISLIAPVALVLVAENTGHIKALSSSMDRDLMPYLGHGFLGDAVGTIVSALGGGTGQTTYAENIGVMAMTRVYSIVVFVAAALTAIILGFSPKFGALISSIPPGVMGGLAILLFGLIAATGGKIISDGGVDFARPRTLIVLGSTLAIGVGSAALEWAHTTVANTLRANDLPLTALNAVPTGTLDVGVAGYSFAIGNIALATFVAILVNQILVIVERFGEERSAAPLTEAVAHQSGHGGHT